MRDNPPPAVGTRSPTQLVNAYIEAWNTRDGAAVVGAVAAGGTYVDPGLPEPVSGEAFAGYVQTLATAFPDYAFTWQTFEANERVTAQWTMTGTYAAPMPGLPGPTGASFALPGVSIIEVGSEGISTIEVYFDQLGMLSQFGVDIDLSVGAPDA